MNTTAKTTDVHLPDFAAFRFGKNGSVMPIKAEDPPSAHKGTVPEGEFEWIHFKRDSEDGQAWLKNSNLDPFVFSALTKEETRPRCTAHGDGIVLILRGVNLNAATGRKDMISVRLWIEKTRVVGVWLRPLLAIRDVMDTIERGQSPQSTGDLVAKIALRLADRAEPMVTELNENIDHLEVTVLDESANLIRGPLADIRRNAILMRRFMFPQRDALTSLEIEDVSWLKDRDRNRIREASDRITRLGEELDSIRDRAQVVHDQLMDKRAESMNSRMLVLSVVAAYFLPLSFLTGLLGVNVGGMPGIDSPWAFSIVCLLLVAVSIVQFALFRRMRLGG